MKSRLAFLLACLALTSCGTRTVNITAHKVTINSLATTDVSIQAIPQ